MSNQNYQLETSAKCVRITGDIGYYNIDSVESDLLAIIHKDLIRELDFQVTFDTSLVVLMCSIQAWSKKLAISLEWSVPDKLPVLLKLYGVEKYFLKEN